MTRRNRDFHLEFDAGNKVLRLSVHGEVTDQFLFEAYAALKESCVRLGPCRCIVDYTEATNIKISSSAIRHLARTSPIFPLTLNVAPQSAMFGMARMFQILSSDDRPNFRVVHTMQEALDVLGVKTPSSSALQIELDETA